MEPKRYQKKYRPRGYRYFNRETFISRGQALRAPRQDEVNGEVRLGIANRNVIFGINKKELLQHMLIIGRSGAGKTTIMRLLAMELHRLHIPFLAFDLVKNSMRYLKHEIPNLVILRWGREFSFNPFKPPPKVKLIAWLLTVCEVTSEIFGFRAASKSFLINKIKFLYDKFDSENSGCFPTIDDLFDLLEALAQDKKSKSASKDYIYRIQNKIYSIKVAMGDSLSVQHGIPIEELLKHPACIELVGVNSSEAQTWIVSLIMAWIASYRTANAHLGNTLRHVFFYDEAAEAFGKEKMGQRNYLIGLVRIVRELGQAIIFSIQSVSSLIDQVKSNVYIIICLSQSGVKDMREAASIIGLDHQAAGILNQLDVGMGIIKLSGRYPYPVVVRFPLVEPKYITEEELDEMNAEDKTIRSLLKKVKSRKNQKKQFAKVLQTSEEPRTLIKKISAREDITDKMKEWLAIVNIHQYRKSLVEVNQAAGIPNSTGSRLNDKAERMNLIEVIKFGNRKYPILLDKGYEALGVEPKTFYGKGAGRKHVLIQYLIAGHFQNYNPIIEKVIMGKSVDVVIQYNGSVVAVEVAMTSVNERQNIEKDIAANVDGVIVACDTGKVRQEVVRIISDFPGQKIMAITAAELLRKDPDQIIKELMT